MKQMEIFCFSLLLNDKNQRELSYFAIKDLTQFYKDLKKINDVKEAIVLQKCNCIEFYIFGNYSSEEKILKLWQQSCLNPSKFDSDKLNIFIGKSCIDHLLKTACGLKSVTLGDNQVLGQLHKAYKESITLNAIGPVLTNLFTNMRQIAKKVKQETGIGVGNISVARSAVDLLKSKTQRTECSILVIGAGEIGSLVAKSLFENNFYNVAIANRSKDNAQKIVSNHYAKNTLDLQECFSSLDKFDVVFFALSTVIDKNIVEKINFKNTALVFDLGNPKNTLYFHGKQGIMDINSIREYSEIIMLKRKQNIDQAINLIHQAISQVEEGISQTLVNIDIGHNFHKQALFDNRIFKNTKLKSSGLYHIRNFLFANDFIEVQTPCIVAVPSDPVRRNPNEELFQCNWYKKRMFLRQSNQIYKQMLILSGFKKIYELGPFWRSHTNPTPRHSSEAMGLDIEIFKPDGIEELLKIIGQILNYMTKNLLADSLIKKDDIIDSKISTFEYTEIQKILEENNIKHDYNEDLGYKIELELSNILKDKYGIDIYAIIHYPRTIKKFYTKRYKSALTETFDVIYRGWELSSGALRETDVNKIIKGMEEFNLNPKKYQFYLDKFESKRPHGGFCIGTDRLFTRLLKLPNVNDVIIYPRNQNEIIP